MTAYRKDFLRKYKEFLNPTPFQKGDKVEAFGCKGEIKSVGVNGYVTVKFEDCESTVVFKTDGKLMSWHKKASLRKV
jgi:hypothetical protein